VESVTGIETLKAMAVEPQMQRRWEEQLAGYVAASFRVLSLGNMASQSVQLVSKLVTAGVLFFGAKLVIDGSLSVGELVAFNMLAGRVSAPVLRLAQIWQDFHQARLSVARLGDILNTPAEPTFNTGRAALPAIRGDITFERVTFRYRVDGPEVLNDVSFNVPAGQIVGIVGPSGSGKSTLLRLIGGLLEPTQGNISVFGMTPAEAAEQVLYLPQSCELFETSIRHNLELLSCAPRARILQVAQQTGLSRMLESLPMGEETRVAAQGQNLSSGQRQLILLTAAFASHREVLLLDESTGQIDVQTRSRFDWAALTRGRTVIWVEHDQGGH